MSEQVSPYSAFKVQSLNAWRGAGHVVQDVSFELSSGRLAIVGRNGMGKTTLCDALTGLLNADAKSRSTGSVVLEGRELGGAAPHQIARAGIGYVPQGRRIFPSLTAEENLRLVARRDRSWSLPRVYELFPRLAERRRTGSGLLSGGEQQMLAIGRALLTDPKVLIMDEPSEGLAPAVVEQLIHACIKLESEGVQCLVVEQNLRVAMALAERVLVLANGRVVADVKSQELAASSELQQRYLGVAPLVVA